MQAVGGGENTGVLSPTVVSWLLSGLTSCSERHTCSGERRKNTPTLLLHRLCATLRWRQHKQPQSNLSRKNGSSGLSTGQREQRPLFTAMFDDKQFQHHWEKKLFQFLMINFPERGSLRSTTSSSHEPLKTKSALESCAFTSGCASPC